MALKPRAENPTITIPKRNFVQQQAEDDGYQRVLIDGQPMLMKPGAPTISPLDYVPKKRSKSIGPDVQVAATRG